MTLKLGVHIRANNSSHSMDDQLFQYDWPVMTWLDNGSEWGRLNTYHAAHPSTIITGRIPAIEDYYKPRVAIADPVVTGNDVANMIINMYAPSYVYWRTDELNNELDWSNKFNLSVMQKLVPAGYRWCGPMTAEGIRVLKYDGIDDWPRFQEMFIYMNAHSENTLPVIDTYLTGTSAEDVAAHLTRFTRLLEFWDMWGLNNLRLAFGETGPEVPLLNTVPDATTRLSYLKTINAHFNLYPRVIGGAVYDFSNIAGRYSMYGEVFPMFMEWAKGQAIELPPEPPTTPPSTSGKIKTTTSVNLRRAPVVEDASKIAVLPPNYEMELAGPTSGDFVQLKAWIHKDYIKPA